MALATRSAPTSLGLSYKMGMPERTPGPSTTQGTSNQRLAIWRSAVVTRGTDDVTAMPVTTSAISMRSRVEQLRQQQGVLIGGAVVDCRQPPVVPQPGRLGRGGRGGAAVGGGIVAGAEGEETDHRLGVADVDGEQHVQSSTASRPRSNTGAEWVSAPTDNRSAPAAAYRGRFPK